MISYTQNDNFVVVYVSFNKLYYYTINSKKLVLWFWTSLGSCLSNANARPPHPYPPRPTHTYPMPMQCEVWWMSVVWVLRTIIRHTVGLIRNYGYQLCYVTGSIEIITKPLTFYTGKEINLRNTTWSNFTEQISFGRKELTSVGVHLSFSSLHQNRHK